MLEQVSVVGNTLCKLLYITAGKIKVVCMTPWEGKTGGLSLVCPMCLFPLLILVCILSL